MELDPQQTSMIDEGGSICDDAHSRAMNAQILLVDGSEDGSGLLDLLRQKDYKVCVATSGEEALKLAGAAGLELVIADVTTPALKGFGFVERLRSDPRTSHVSVIVLAEKLGEEKTSETLGAGADDYAVKPVHARELLVRIALQLRIVHIRRAADESLRQSELRYRRLFEAAHDGILIMDAETLQITDVNPFLIELLQFPRQYFIGKELWQLGMFKDKDESLEAITEVKKRGSFRYENMPLHVHSGRQNPVEVVSNMYCEDNHLVIQCNIRDIRDRIKLQYEREALLGREQSSRAEAEAANEIKDLFLATLSHELRTPLNAIIGWSSILTEGSPSPDDLKEAAETINRNAWTQAHLIDDLLDVSTIISGKLKLEIEPCELGDAIASAVTTVRPAAEAKQIQLVVEIEPDVGLGLYDSARMQQVFWNLLSNAIKFTPEGGKVTVSLSRTGPAVQVKVSDSGIGIDPDFLPLVFERFRQADTGARKRTGGVGLGLSIAKNIVEMHGGAIRADSDGEDEGTTFTVTLPTRALRVSGVDLSSEKHSGTSADEVVKLAGLRILVVDDDPDARKLLTRLFEGSGAIVCSAGSAVEALHEIEERVPDIMVSDLGMPEMDGFDLMREVRRLGHNARELPAVALTALAGKADSKQALLAGYQVHVPKPVDPQNLLIVVASLSGRTG